VRNCSADEGGPLGTGVQELVSNHLRRLWSRAMVVSAEGKGSAMTGSGDRQEEDRKGTTDEVSKTLLDDGQNRGWYVPRDELRRYLFTGGVASGMRGGLSLP